MNTKICIDSSVFLSSFIGGEVNSKRSNVFFQFIQENTLQISIPVLVLMELLHAFFRATGDATMTEQLYEYMLELNMDHILEITPLESNFLLYFSEFHKLFSCKSSDSIIALHARKQNIPLVTWDKALIESCDGQIKAMTPEKFMKVYSRE